MASPTGFCWRDGVFDRGGLAELEVTVRQLRKENSDLRAEKIRVEGLLRYFHSQASFWKEQCANRKVPGVPAGRVCFFLANTS